VQLYVIQLNEVCHHDGNTHTCLYLGALGAGSRALMLPCKKKHSLRFYPYKIHPQKLQNILNEEDEEQLIIPILLKYFDSVHSVQCYMHLTIKTNNFHVQSMYKKFTVFPPKGFNGQHTSSESNT
jgi:hypothetical protein